MAAPKRPARDELLRRMAAWGDEWRAVAASTEPADRPRAEAAIRSLYAASGRAEPAFAWVPSPAAGIMACTFASTAHAEIVSPYARGDIGSGANREFNGLADPFGMEPAWTLRLAASVRDALPPERVPRGWAIHPLGAVAEALGLDGTARTAALVRAVATESSLDPRLGREASAGAAAGKPAFDGATVDLAAGVLGDAWPSLVELVGRDLAGSLFAEATRRLAAAVLTDVRGRRDAIQAMQPGQWDAFTPALAAARDVVGGWLWRPRAGRAEREAQVDARLEVARSAGPWWALDGLAIVSERPLVLRRDDRGRPHCADGPAIAWADGREAHAWHGVAVEPWVVTDPGRITVEAVGAERNVEVRRVLVERLGEERLIREGGAKLVHEDETGRLWRRELARLDWSWGSRDEPIVVVEVRNATPEPDGSHRIYYLRVPPTMRTAREAVAWTFGLGAVEYRPAVES
jgi:hypothetical protein